ncbi:MAG: hypothetical protein DRN29_03105 [Thermoplasmata archaeon]|nr:MAG: hypothetical protein DRN29_03105 [Thermoplasmata archaeon]
MQKQLNSKSICYVELNTLLLPLGVIPSLFLLYLIIGEREGKFKEKSIIIVYIGGIILGSVIYIMEGMILYPMITGDVYLNLIIIFSFIFSFLDQLVKLAVLNLSALSDSGLPLYGASFSLGFSSVFAPLLFGRTLEVGLENAMLVALPFSVMLINCSIGIIIGTGVKRNMRGKYFGLATVAGMIIWITVIISIVYSLAGESVISAIFSVCSIVISSFAFITVYKKHLPYAMMDRRELRKL